MKAILAITCILAACGFGAAFYMLFLAIELSMNGVPFN
jgi:hypothetical protein